MAKHFNKWYVVTIKYYRFGQEVFNGFANRCFELGTTGLEQNEDSMTAYFDFDSDIETITGSLQTLADSLIELGMLQRRPEICVEVVGEENWAENWKLHFQPLEIGKRLLIVPPWHEKMKVPGRITIVIEPGMAFGTGSHESTELALILLERYCRPGLSIWDIGTGTGILSITAAKLGAGSIYAIDSDIRSIEAARLNAERNGVSVKIEQKSLEESGGKTYSMIAANINRRIICENAKKLLDSLCDKGILILSGLESRDEQEVSRLFISGNLKLLDCESKNRWTALTFEKE